MLPASASELKSTQESTQDRLAWLVTKPLPVDLAPLHNRMRSLILNLPAGTQALFMQHFLSYACAGLT